jgi:hypothetical protein
MYTAGNGARTLLRPPLGTGLVMQILRMQLFVKKETKMKVWAMKRRTKMKGVVKVGEISSIL